MPGLKIAGWPVACLATAASGVVGWEAAGAGDGGREAATFGVAGVERAGSPAAATVGGAGSTAVGAAGLGGAGGTAAGSGTGGQADSLETDSWEADSWEADSWDADLGEAGPGAGLEDAGRADAGFVGADLVAPDAEAGSAMLRGVGADAGFDPTGPEAARFGAAGGGAPDCAVGFVAAAVVSGGKVALVLMDEASTAAGGSGETLWAEPRAWSRAGLRLLRRGRFRAGGRFASVGGFAIRAFTPLFRHINEIRDRGAILPSA
jgi:hypothetical protein